MFLGFYTTSTLRVLIESAFTIDDTMATPNTAVCALMSCSSCAGRDFPQHVSAFAGFSEKKRLCYAERESQQSQILWQISDKPCSTFPILSSGIMLCKGIQHTHDPFHAVGATYLLGA